MRVTRCTALLLAPIGVVVGHALSGLVQRGPGVVSPAATAVIVVIALTSWACTGDGRTTCSGIDGSGMTRQLVAQASLIGGIESIGLGASVFGLSGTSLHDPAMIVGVVCQVVAAIVVHQAAGLAVETVARLRADGLVVRVVASPSNGVASAAPNPFLGSPVPRSITGRAPPVLRVLSPIRS